MGIDQFKKDLKEKTQDGGLTDGKDLSVFRQRISKWADSVAHHGLNNLGERIEILSTTGRSSYLIITDGQYEARSIATEEHPYTGESIYPEFVQFSSINEMWQLPLVIVKKFSNHIKGYGIKEEVYSCPLCRGNGQLSCDQCNGHGEIQCSECRGRGKIDCRDCNGRSTENCHGCGGSGSIKSSVYNNNYTPVTCPSCNGRQRVPCSSCGGRGTNRCSNCTNGRTLCIPCAGKGVLICDQCSGTGKLVRCEYLKDSFVHNHKESWSHATCVSAELIKQIEKIINEVSNVAMIEEVVIPPEAIDVDLSLSDPLKKSLSSLQQAVGLGTINQDYRILRQRVAIQKVEVAEILYRYEGREYTIWSFGASGMWALISPISESRDRLVEVVQKNIKQKDLSTALEDIDKVIVMANGEGVQSNEYTKTRDNIQSMIRRQYVLGGVLGGTILPVFGNLIGVIIGLIYWNIFEGKIRRKKQRIFYPFFVSVLIGTLIYALALILF